MQRPPDLPPSADLPALLTHVRWIGGGSGAGKSTLARRLAQNHDAIHYESDVKMGEHAKLCPPELGPGLKAFKRMSMDERWVNRSPKIMLDSFHWYNGEGFGYIVEDLLTLPSNVAVIAEGFRLLPSCVQPLLNKKSDAVWLLPSPEFRRFAFDARGTSWDIPSKTSDPERALVNLLSRDAMFTELLAHEVDEIGLDRIGVDMATAEDDLYDLLERRLF